MEPVFFKTKNDFYDWLAQNHDKEPELLVGFYKVGSGRPSISWPESVDVALCFGWIDAVRKGIDDISYTIRFTRRKPASNWSAVNIAKMEELAKQGLVHATGHAAYGKRQEKKSKIYSYENKPKPLSEAYARQFAADGQAWQYFTTQPPGYQKTMTYWVMSAAQEATRLKRLETLIRNSREGKRMR